jgi:hypothetical protein
VTNPGLASLDDACFSAFFGAGLADDAVFYRAGDGVGIPCKALLDRAVAFQNQTSGIVSHATTITVRRSEIGPDDPDTDSFFTVGRETFIVDSLLPTSDESRCVLTVVPKTC